MQKWVWGCFALAVFGGTGVYLAADHAVRHPDSFVGRCAVSAVKLTSRMTPAMFNHAAGVLPLQRPQTTLVDQPACRVHAESFSCTPCTNGFEPIVVEVEPESTHVVQTVSFATVNRSTANTPMLMPYAAENEEDVDALAWFGCGNHCRQLVNKCLTAWQTISEGGEVVQLDESIDQPEEQNGAPLTPDEGNNVEGIDFPQQVRDPHYHDHHGYCPYSGRCPQPYHTRYPIIPRADETNRGGKTPASVETMEVRPTDIKETDDSSF